MAEELNIARATLAEHLNRIESLMMDDLLGSFTNISISPDEFIMFKDMVIDDSETQGYGEDEQFKRLLENMHTNIEFEVDPAEEDEVEVNSSADVRGLQMRNLVKLISNLKLSGIYIPEHVEEAMYKVDVEDFCNFEVDEFYLDRPVAFMKSQNGGIKNISAPHMIVTMLHYLELTEGQHVVIYGAKGGYLSALVAHVIEKNGSVTVIDHRWRWFLMFEN